MSKIQNQKKVSDDAFRESDAHYQAILNTTVDGIITIDERGTIRSFNRAAERMFGYMEDEIVGENIRILTPEPHRSNHDAYLENYMKTGIRKIIGIGREVNGVRKDGSNFPLYIAVSELDMNGQRLFTGITRDMTEQKKLQHELIRKGNLASLGELSAMVAHEVKNPLAGISSAIQVLYESFDVTDSRRAVMQEVLHQVNRLDATVRDLLSFGKPWIPSLVRVDFNMVIERTLSTVKAGFKTDNIVFQHEFDHDCTAFIDPQQMEHLFINLFQNSLQAMPEGGTLSVKCHGRENEVELIITDTGEGMDAVAQDQMFKPFYSTKTRGTGLGLPISKRIIEAHQGEINIKSTPGKGTSITLLFPKNIEEIISN